MYTIAALYVFVPVEDPEALQKQLQERLAGTDIAGTLLVATEGLNGTIAGSDAPLRAFLDWLKEDPRFAALEAKFSGSDKAPFRRLKVRLKREIVTMGVPDIDPVRGVGAYVAPEDWNALIRRDDTLLIDTRNDYEVSIGSFEGAVDPETTNFRDFPAWVARNENLLKSKKNVAMFCTGGIRCEKSTAYLKSLGYESVFHLKGGILKYLEQVPADESLWRGECFVFDERVSVRHGLEAGDYDLCRACRHPITEAEKQSPDYVEGVSCARCINTTSQQQKDSFRERQKQIALAKAHGTDHFAGPQKPE